MLLRGERRPRVALVGRMLTGKSSIFRAASSAAPQQERLLRDGDRYDECVVKLGLEEISLVDLPAVESLCSLSPHDSVVVKYLLWGDRWPPIAAHEAAQPGAAFNAPDVLIQVVDATALQRDLELTLELSLLGRPLVIALNRVDEARRKGLYINARALSELLGVPVVATAAHMGLGVAELFAAALNAARGGHAPRPQSPSAPIAERLDALRAVLARPEVDAAFRVPASFLLMHLAASDDYFVDELVSHVPHLLPEVLSARAEAERYLPRSLAEELHADRHHRAAVLFENVTQFGGAANSGRWQRLLDGVFLHPRWGLLGSLGVFALVLVMVFEVSKTLDSWTAAPLMEWAQQWQPESTFGVIARAVIDGLIGLIGIAIPYMLPLVLLLVVLEESGIMHRVAFVVDRAFHSIGLHGSVAASFLVGLGCNVPAISLVAATTQGKDRLVATLLLAFVPCSARSAIILAMGGKYLGAAGVCAIFALTFAVLALLGRLLARRYRKLAVGLIQEIPPYALPNWRGLLGKTWERTSDIVTIVTPLLVAGSVVLALLNHFAADRWINLLLVPITEWWLGLPALLGVPILFGVLRKELSLLMVYQALGTMEIEPVLDWVQIATFLVFLTFYIPCVSTFAVMLRTIGWRQAVFSAGLSVAVALLISGALRLVLEVARALAG
ncbi:MAG TPA: ferrous iron transporter B [Accumulibacter sp.]|uniref:ferrous iron transporter B n=2 Tax=Accumulibacter sp. TaxID=2053492 RepID=UPI00287B450D|nr:ferrous iron transporter B [Accumulibacter sp.]MDS4056589.1 ferrous iron transporter B [Accumulibacter sp.]HMW64505.1 ferrous iron transporter B [Accumulibacter sp.]HNC25957.1 ferrous iron transporter B [Accumulibacter sp.]HND39801.1 ferrous iron transporter B [Accumulibacter sp.]HNG16495.1 ferrous iron transporter B [Accumulibacter sp.]